jgi:hypothetical protein
MREGVDRLGDEVMVLRELTESELREIGLAVHPVRRTTRRLGFRRRQGD